MTNIPRTTPPSPAAATDQAAFVAELRRLRTWSGLSFRQLQRSAAAAGETLPASTAATMLGKNRLPREELLVAFVRACGLDGDDMRPWLTARAAIADGTATTAHSPVPAQRTISRWRTTIAAVATVAAVLAGGAAVTAGFDTTDEQEISVPAP